MSLPRILFEKYTFISDIQYEIDEIPHLVCVSPLIPVYLMTRLHRCDMIILKKEKINTILISLFVQFHTYLSQHLTLLLFYSFPCFSYIVLSSPYKV